MSFLRRFRTATLVIEAEGAAGLKLTASESLVESALALWFDTFTGEEEPKPEGAGAADTERAEDYSEPELKIGFQRRDPDEDDDD